MNDKIADLITSMREREKRLMWLIENHESRHKVLKGEPRKFRSLRGEASHHRDMANLHYDYLEQLREYIHILEDSPREDT